MSGYNYGPSENELVLNVTSQLLADLASRYPASTALAPTRREENILGYDVDVRELLGVVLQFKRPSEVRARTMPTQLPEPTSTEVPVRFKTDIDQWITLVTGFNVGQAFYALPPTVESTSLHQALKQTVFVDVYGVLPETSLLYTVPDGCEYTGGPFVVEGKIKNHSTYRIPPEFIYCFDDLKRGLSSNRLGLQFYTPIRPGSRFDPEQPAGEQRSETDALTEFKYRVTSLTSSDTEADGFRVQEALQQLDDLTEFRSEKITDERDPALRAMNDRPLDRWKNIFVNYQTDPYDPSQVDIAFGGLTDAIQKALEELRADLLSDPDGAPATQLLQRASAQMCMLGRE